MYSVPLFATAPLYAFKINVALTMRRFNQLQAVQ